MRQRWCNFDVRVCDVKRLQQERHRESVLAMSSDATTERVLNCSWDVTVNTTVLTAPTSSVVVSRRVYFSMSVILLEVNHNLPFIAFCSFSVNTNVRTFICKPVCCYVFCVKLKFYSDFTNLSIVILLLKTLWLAAVEFISCAVITDAWLAADETVVPPTDCKSTEFRCTDNSCIDVLLRCNGVYDCTDRSDEFDCGT